MRKIKIFSNEQTLSSLSIAPYYKNFSQRRLRKEGWVRERCDVREEMLGKQNGKLVGNSTQTLAVWNSDSEV